MDGTHIKENMSLKKHVIDSGGSKALSGAAGRGDEVNRLAHGKRPLKNNDDTPPKQKTEDGDRVHD